MTDSLLNSGLAGMELDGTITSEKQKYPLTVEFGVGMIELRQLRSW
jgi:hypothetical protein